MSKQIDCAKTTNAATEVVCVGLLDTLFRVLRGPLRLDETLQHDDDYVVAILHDVWQAVVAVCNIKPNRAFELLMTLMELLNGRQLELLYGRVMVESEPPLTAAMLQSIRAVYAHIVKLNNRGVPNLYRKSTANILRAMTRLPGLVQHSKMVRMDVHLHGGGENTPILSHGSNITIPNNNDSHTVEFE